MNQNLQTPVPCRALSSAGLTRNGHPRKRKPLTQEQRERAKELHKIWLSANRERVKLTKDKWRMENRDKERISHAAWLIANRDKVKASGAAWRKANREKHRADSAEWRKRNPEKAKEGQDSWKAANPEKVKALAVAWRKENIQRRKSYAKNYRSDNKDKFRAQKQLRRARKRSASIGSSVPIVAWAKSLRKSKQVICYWCGLRVAGKKAHMDHIIALANGGAHSIDNLCISCSTCNQSKNAKTLEQWNASLAKPVLF